MVAVAGVHVAFDRCTVNGLSWRISIVSRGPMSTTSLRSIVFVASSATSIGVRLGFTCSRISSSAGILKNP